MSSAMIQTMFGGGVAAAAAEGGEGEKEGKREGEKCGE
jgi:hypothetical protein